MQRRGLHLDTSMLHGRGLIAGVVEGWPIQILHTPGEIEGATTLYLGYDSGEPVDVLEVKWTISGKRRVRGDDGLLDRSPLPELLDHPRFASVSTRSFQVPPGFPSRKRRAVRVSCVDFVDNEALLDLMIEGGVTLCDALRDRYSITPATNEGRSSL